MELGEILAYALVVAVSLAALRLLRSTMPVARLSPALRKKLSAKYSRFVFWVDAGSVVLVFALSAIYFVFFSLFKSLLLPAPAAAVFYSAPTAELFTAAFTLAIATAGDAARSAVFLTLGGDFWRYYAAERAWFDTQKAYSPIKIFFLLLTIPFLVDGMQHHVAITGRGIEYYDLFSLS